MAVYTLIAQDNTAHKKSLGLVSKLGPLICSYVASVTDGAKLGILVATVWSDAKFVAIFTDGSLAILLPAEYAAVLALVAGTL